MQITREGDYGIRSVLYLARQPLNKISFVNEISEDYHIPRSFLAKILQKLVKGKLSLNVCLTDKKKCGFSKRCPITSVWVAVQSKITDVLKKTNFEDLAKQKN